MMSMGVPSDHSSSHGPDLYLLNFSKVSASCALRAFREILEGFDFVPNLFLECSSG